MRPDPVEVRLAAREIETPSWGYGLSGTRFKVFAQPGAPRDVWEKLEDAAEVQRLTGTCPKVAIHIPWDRVDDPRELAERAGELGLRIGSVNPNLFQQEAYRLGSVCHPDPSVRRMATDHLLECVDIGRAVGSDALSIWLADGTNYPGQDDPLARRERMLECFEEAYAAMPEPMEMLVEYKLYEPAFYHTDLQDWGSALLACQRLGPRAKVLVDLGHHAQGVNIEHIVAILWAEGRLGGFHYNNRKYGDDDLVVGSVNPWELFLIQVELARAEDVDGRHGPVRHAIDQSHNVEPKVEAMVLSVMSLQESHAKALLVDRSALEAAQREGDVLGALRMLQDAYACDVRPLCARVREALGAAADPVGELRASGYAERAAEARAGGAPAGWTS
jgi:L-rhamnose isomerase/sugar isomerase